MSHLRRSGFGTNPGTLDSQLAAQIVESIAVELGRGCVDLADYEETYYFRDGDENQCLAAVLDYAVILAAAGRCQGRADVRVAATILGTSLDDLATSHFLRAGGDTRQILRNYAAEHAPRSAPCLGCPPGYHDPGSQGPRTLERGPAERTT